MRAVALLALLVLSAQLVAGAAPNARDDLVLGHPARTVAISADGVRVMAGVADDGSRVQAPRDQDTWMLYTILGSSFHVDQDGDLDPASCDNTFSVSDDCATGAVAVALDADGSHFAAAGLADNDVSIVVFGLALSGERSGEKKTVNGVVIGLESSASGGRVVAVADDTGLGDGGLIAAWNVGASVDAAWTAREFAGDPVDFDLTADGAWAVVAAGNDVLRYDSAGAVRRDPTGSAVNAVAVADDPDAMAVAGMQSGAFRIYSRHNTGSDRELNIPGSGAIVEVAIAPDASSVAIARADGRLTVHTLSKAPVLLGTTPIFNQDIGDAVSELAYSGDGSVLVVRQGTKLQMRAAISGLPVLWEDTLPAAAVGLALDGTGDTLAVVHGSSLRLYEAERGLTLTAPQIGALGPGQTHAVTLTLANTGNRHETVNLTASATGGIGAQLLTDQVVVLPDAPTTVQLNLTIPADQAPGTVTVTVGAEAASGQSAAATLTGTIPEVDAWNLSANNFATSLPVVRGQSADFKLTLRNDGNVVKAPPVAVATVGAGWQASMVGATETLGAGESRALTVRLTAPADAGDLEQGKARVSVPGQPFIELVATVGAAFSVELDAPGTAFVEPRGTATFQIVVRNTGNVADRFQVVLEGLTGGWSAELDNGFAQVTTPQLAAGAERQIAVEVGAPSTTLAGEVTVRATSLADGGASAARTVILQPQVQTQTQTDPPERNEPAPLWLALVALGMLAMRARRR